MREKTVLQVVLGALLLVSVAVSAAPSLFWDHIDVGAMSQAECVGKANGLFSAEKAGTLTRDEDSVRSWSEHTVGTVECIKKDDGKLIVMLLVGSDDASAGNRLFNALKQGMKP
jgi:hypothetical protein